jgi:hypothetical protein
LSNGNFLKVYTTGVRAVTDRIDQLVEEVMLKNVVASDANIVVVCSLGELVV